MLNFRKKLVVMLSSFSILACSTMPPKITPSVPLISSSQPSVLSSIPSELAGALDSNQGNILTLNGKTFSFTERYFSALGFPCVKVNETTQNESTTNTYCQIDEQWQMLPSIETSN